MKSNFEKPITVVRQEFIDGLINYVNNSSLPLFVIEPILRDIYMEVKAMSQKQYESEKMQYENSLKEMEKLQECSTDSK
jgi:hypothetical protein